MKKLYFLFLFFLILTNVVYAATKLEHRTKTQSHSLDQAVQETLPIDSAKLEGHIRQTLSVPISWSIKISSVLPSPYSEFYQAVIVFEQEQNRREQPVFIAKDGKNFIIGNLYSTSTDYDAARREKISLEDVFVKGNQDAPITIVEYSDPQCRACKQAKQVINVEKILKDYKGKVRWVTKHIPIVPSHDWAAPASAACLCAGEQNPEYFWQMQKYFFDNQSYISFQNVTEKAVSAAHVLKLDMQKFQSCYDSENVVKKIKADMREAENVGIVMTPSFVINGRLINGGVSEQELRLVIDQFLKE